MEFPEIEKLEEELSKVRATDDSLDLAKHLTAGFESQLMQTLSAEELSLGDLNTLVKRWGELLIPAIRSASNRIAGCTGFGLAENVVNNVVLRLLRIIRAEALFICDAQQTMTVDSLLDEPIHRFLTGSATTSSSDSQSAPPVENLEEALTEYGTELFSLRENLGKRAAEFARDPSLCSRVLVMGRSRSTGAFIKALSKYHSKCSTGAELNFIVAETGMFTTQASQVGSDASAFVGDLKQLGLTEVETAEDHLWYSMLVPRGHSPSTVRLVVITALAVLADGSVLAVPGSWFLALSANRGALPVVIVAPQYKLTPFFNVANASPRFDVIKPELINFIVTDIGTFSPSSIPKAMTELYGLQNASICFSP